MKTFLFQEYGRLAKELKSLAEHDPVLGRSLAREIAAFERTILRIKRRELAPLMRLKEKLIEAAREG